MYYTVKRMDPETRVLKFTFQLVHLLCDFGQVT